MMLFLLPAFDNYIGTVIMIWIIMKVTRVSTWVTRIITFVATFVIVIAHLLFIK
jgi:hypothetical protein